MSVTGSTRRERNGTFMRTYALRQLNGWIGITVPVIRGMHWIRRNIGECFWMQPFCTLVGERELQNSTLLKLRDTNGKE
jgi:hypothetical protein